MGYNTSAGEDEAQKIRTPRDETRLDLTVRRTVPQVYPSTASEHPERHCKMQLTFWFEGDVWSSMVAPSVLVKTRIDFEGVKPL